MKRNVFAKKIHADEATFHLLHLDLEFAARLKWHQFQIPSQHYFLLGLHTTCSFLERKAPAVSNMPKGCGAALGTELATKDCSHSFHGTKPHQMKAWRVNRNRLNPVTTQCCPERSASLSDKSCWVNILFCVGTNWCGWIPAIKRMVGLLPNSASEHSWLQMTSHRKIHKIIIAESYSQMAMAKERMTVAYGPFG